MSQHEFWNGEAATIWTVNAARIDALIAPFGEAAMDALGPRPGERVLDIGCGAGATSRALAERVSPSGAVLGVDISAPMLEVARARGGGPEYLHADAGAAPLPGPFDAAYSRFGVMFFEDPAAAFAHVGRALTPGGRLGFVCWRSMMENAWAHETLGVALPFLREPPTAPPPGAPGPFAFADGARLRGILDAAGFAEVTVAPLDIPYRLGASPEDAADLMLQLGPLSRVVREQGLDVAPVREALEALMVRHADDRGVHMAAACWVVSARAGSDGR